MSNYLCRLNYLIRINIFRVSELSNGNDVTSIEFKLLFKMDFKILKSSHLDAHPRTFKSRLNQKILLRENARLAQLPIRIEYD